MHLDRYVVVRQVYGGAAQSFTLAIFLERAQKQLTLAEQLFSSYKAESFGYRLDRKLTEFGLTNYVVRQRDWDEYGKKLRQIDTMPSNWPPRPYHLAFLLARKPTGHLSFR